MDTATKHKDNTNCSISLVASAVATICSSDSLSMFPPPPHDVVSANSIELNAAASLSDDSGVPLTTNSSISSGDSYRLGMCKFEIELVESDGEVSQFDSLDNCSEGGMSAENFNTLKKGPLAPIDPPPEFRDSPKTTLVRSMAQSRISSLRRWTSSQSSFEHLKENDDNECANIKHSSSNNIDIRDECVNYKNEEKKSLKSSYAMNRHLYASDSILNIHTDNLYDEPNNLLSSSLGNSIDAVESDSASLSLPTPPPPVSLIKIKQVMCPYFQDHTRYFKAIPSEQDNLTMAANRFNSSGLSDIHDYDLYYSIKRNTYQQYEGTLQRKLMYSPISGSHHCHNQIYHGGGCSNRPNSRNSLNSRLSSSHNSLSVSSSNKPDDSIFITQAMSHDALLTREISDFYTVPIDSDIYALPVDMIKSERKCAIHKYESPENNFLHHQTKDITSILSCRKHNIKCPHQQQKVHRRQNKNKRKKRCPSNCDNNNKECDRIHSSPTRFTSTFVSLAGDPDHNCQDFHSTEPLHMTLDEVKQFYHTLYSDTRNSLDSGGAVINNNNNNNNNNININNNKIPNGIKTTNEILWSNNTTGNSRGSNALASEKSNNSLISHVSTITNKVHDTSSSNSNHNNNNNNNNNITTINNNNSNQQFQQCQKIIGHTNANLINTSNTKQSVVFPNEKKFHFTLNLKQKFCSIFRFRRNHNRCRSATNNNVELNDNREYKINTKRSSEEKRKKFQSRALPPLPKRAVENIAEENDEDDKKNSEKRPFQFTSSIEKVKDYGWYWGPLSSEAAEKVLSNEPDGSFIVRDSSDDHYIFSLSFKLNNCVRHVRIEQDQGTFSFGSYAKFKSQTITEFIEKAVEHSRSGRYLFFLHRRPEHGPMRVQLTNPVSRFKHVQSLQHMCRFVILKTVIRKDLIQTLPLPRRLLDYLNYKHCYSEQIESDSSHSQISGEGSL